MIEQGKIIRILPNNQVEVALTGSSCQKCQGCITAAGSCEQTKIILQNINDHKLGDEVEIEVPAKIFYTAFFLVFILPLIVLVVSILILQKIKVDQGINLIISFILFLVSYYFANRYDKKIKNAQIYRIIR